MHKKVLTRFTHTVNLRTVTMGNVRLRPSKKFMALITIHGSLNAAVKHWGVPYMTVRDWLDGNNQLPGNAVARIVEVTKLPYEALFEHKGGRR